MQLRNWWAMLRHGWDAGDLDASGVAVADAIEARLRTGCPLGAITVPEITVMVWTALC